MNFSFSEDQEELREYARDFLAEVLPATRVAEIADSELGIDPAVSEKIGSLGWFDPELTFLDQAVIVEEAGYALLPGPWFTTSVLVRPLLADDDPLAVRIDAGSARVTLAWIENERRTSVLDIPFSESCVVNETSLKGTKILVPDAALCESVLVPVRDGKGIALFEVTLDPQQVVVRGTMDRTRRFGDVTLDGLIARRVSMAGGSLDVVRLQTRLLAALSCEAVGVGRRALDLAVAYAKEREQFGKIIGSYQGVSHRLSESFKEIELAKSLAYRAAWAVDTDVAHEPGHYELSRAAKAQAGSAAVFACEQAIQVLGGIGITWDHPIHRWFKRAMLLSAWEGDAAAQRREIAEALLQRRTV